jgi:hypothetical protein
MTAALLGEDAPGVKFLDDKIANHEKGRDEPVLADERQLLYALVNMT